MEIKVFRRDWSEKLKKDDNGAKKMEVKQSDSLEFLKNQKDYENDIIFADPPYALGSEVIIRQDGKVDYAKANDFMNKWEMPTGDYWEKWFIEAYRTLKHGGYLIMYGMDRQTLLFKYYASLAGFQEQQSIYWYYISNFPKATDLSKMIDKNAGVERERIRVGGVGTNKKDIYGVFNGEIDSDNAITDLAKKYEGYKYSISPLKQTCETIMVFKKPNKTGSVLHDTLAMENGDDTIACSALNIDGNRVAPYNENDTYDIRHYQSEDCFQNLKPKETQFLIKPQPEGRYPSQTFVDSQVAEKLDRQSGVSGGGTIISNVDVSRKGLKADAPAFNSKNSGIDVNKGQGLSNYGDIGGCSKILHKCDYEQIDFDLFIYEPKVDSRERNNGLDDFNNSAITDRKGNGLGRVCNICGAKQLSPCDCENNSWVLPANMKNNHPTLKPIDLNAKILKLFKTPNEQRICYPFAGSGSEIIGGLKAGFQDWTACEINQEYVDIANARIKHYKENEYVQLDLFGGE